MKGVKQMKRLWHPTFPNVSVEVAGDQAAAWIRCGWRKTPPKARKAPPPSPPQGDPPTDTSTGSTTAEGAE